MADLSCELWDMVRDKGVELKRAGKEEEADILRDKIFQLMEFRGSPDTIRRDRLREVRKARLEEDKAKLDDLEKQLAKAESRKAEIRSKREKEEERYYSLQAREAGTKEQHTSKADDTEQSRIDVEILSRELETESHHADEVLEKRNMIKKQLGEEEENAKRRDRNLRSFLTVSIIGDIFEKLLESEGVSLIKNKLKGCEIEKSKTFIDLYITLTRHGIIETGNYVNLSISLISASKRYKEYQHIIKKIECFEDIILDPYDTKDKLSLSDFRKIRIIGSGGFGAVYIYQNVRNDETIAVKEITFPQSDATRDCTEKTDLEREVRIMRELSKYGHRNIIRYLFDNFGADGKLCIGMEYIAGGSLGGKINGRPLSYDELRSYTFQTLKGVRFLHEKHIVHRDIKPDNILLDSENCIKLVDFGISKELNTFLLTHGATTAAMGTCQYMSPEAVTGNYDDPEKNENEGSGTNPPGAVMSDGDHSKKYRDEGVKGYGIKADIWSVGCVVLEMATGKRPWSGWGNHTAVMFRIGKGYTPPVAANVPDDVKDFLAMTFIVNPADRSSTKDLLKHMLVADFEKKYLENMETSVAGMSPESDDVGAASAETSTNTSGHEAAVETDMPDISTVNI